MAFLINMQPHAGNEVAHHTCAPERINIRIKDDARAREVQTSSSFCIYTVPVPHRRMFVRSSCGRCTDGHWTSLDAFDQHINNGNEEDDPQYPAPRVDLDVTDFFVKSIPSGFRQELGAPRRSFN
ncbi:hypothetical protein B0H13DRAFT_1852181 [Mycena leptocephala]|nr:hypothetical protein B0H13DRAFT_1852181 [Mycena leptocephala]